jgi:hypothetical protein
MFESKDEKILNVSIHTFQFEITFKTANEKAEWAAFFAQWEKRGKKKGTVFLTSSVRS